MRAVWRESAYADLARIRAWIARDAPDRAADVVARILDAIEGPVARFPHLGRKGRLSDTRELVVSGLPYIVVYRVDEARDRLIVLAIFHGAQDR